MIEPAPKVEAAKASAAKPRATPEAEPVVASDRVRAVVAPAVEPASADPPTENGSLSAESAAKSTASVPEQGHKLSVDALRATQRVVFEAPAAVLIGAAERNICDKMLPCFAERTFLSYGEIKRYILILDGNAFVYTEVTDPSPLYTIPLADLLPEREDPKHPDFNSHTISPEANTGLPFENKSRESLRTVLLRDGNGKIAFQLAFDEIDAGVDALDKFISVVLSSKADAKKLSKV